MKKKTIASLLTICLLANNCTFVCATDEAFEAGDVQFVQPVEDNVDEWTDADHLMPDMENLSEEGFAEDMDIALFDDRASDFAVDPEAENEFSDSGDSLIEEELLEDVPVYDISEDSWSEEIEFETESIDEQTLLMAAEADDSTYSGVDGNISWSVENGVLTLSGTGTMNDYASPEEVPWYDSCVKAFIDADEGIITSIEIESGVTSIGSYAFYNCRHVETDVHPCRVTLSCD